MKEQPGVVLITGAGSGIGLATGKLLSECGFRVVGADVAVPERSPFPIEAVDVRDEDAVRLWVDDAVERHRTVRAVIACAGYGLAGAVEETTPAEAAALLDVNAIGTARVARAVLPVLRRQGSGRIVVVGSGAAGVAQPFGGWYSASKAAVEKLGEALRMEAAPFGIEVVTLIPGWTRTGILAAARHGGDELSVYRAVSAEVARRTAEHLANGQDPAVVAAAVLRALTRRRPRAVYRVGRDVRSSFWARRLLPAGLYARLVRDYYGLTGTDADHSAMAALPPFVHPITREPLREDDTGALVTAAGEVGLRPVDTRLRLYADATADTYTGREIASEKVRFAYRIYSKAYPIVATLVFWIVWSGKLGVLGRFYGGQLAAAAERGAAFVDIGVGDGSLTTFAIRSAKVRTLPPLLFVDLSPDMLRKNAKRFRRVPGAVSLIQDVNTLGLEPGSVRALGCYGALHVFPEPQLALKHMAALLADDGELSLSVLTSPGVPWKDRLIERFVGTNTITSNFTADQVLELVAGAGLEPVQTIRNGHQLLLRVRPATEAAPA
ncbi:class I SAM-dependent methyltransferase [Nocardia otitidiscaviarum]|uniref:class I SAM-dependent methyltransferase n=1 Tax=Nocardia otitidiscaviarum TaxID=1823 RepID=UPI001894167D|nr:class I SAM-dependent methyltransferase [Nocardia otitidiscaviarum]MBF6180658.1 SDR family NAD(P)-dependent oxidoreductase [Nocardia otitidiscaviarum]